MSRGGRGGGGAGGGGVRVPGLAALQRDLAALAPELTAACRVVDQAAARLIAEKARARSSGRVAASIRATGSGVSAMVPNSVSPFLKGTAQETELAGWLPLYEKAIETVLGRLQGRTY